jgi:tetratricopeptide (TPR) repeat protein
MLFCSEQSTHTGMTIDNPSPCPCDIAILPPEGRPWFNAVSMALIVLAAVTFYANSLTGPFIFDDFPAILDNPTIRNLGSIRQVLSPPCNGETVSGRPLLNLSLAINYAWAGSRTWDYHATNLLIHILNGLLLWEISRRTFLLPALQPQFGDAGAGLALAIALLWTVHPIQTEAVTYVVQRAESLASLFYLLTLYAVIRGSQSDGPFAWNVLAVGSCWLGMTTKEIVITAPVVILLYDRMFLAGSFAHSLRRRWRLYAGMAASWALLATLVARTGLLAQAIRTPPIDPWSYVRSEPGVILHYLRLSLWPHPLCLDHDWPVASTWSSIWPPMVVLAGLLAAVAVALIRGWRGGFLGAWVFLILAPTSSVVPLSQLAFEHRMYLSLAGAIALVVLTCHGIGRWAIRRWWIANRVGLATGTGLVTVAVALLGVMTWNRNEVYRTELSIWQDTVNYAPHNARARNSLGHSLAFAERLPEAIEQYQIALRLKPDYAEAHNNLGNAIWRLARSNEALECYKTALRLKPDYFEAHNNMGAALLHLGRTDEAVEQMSLASRLRPHYAPLHFSLCVTLLQAGRVAQALEHASEALRGVPDDAQVNQLAAWIMASHEPDQGGNPQQAVQLAQHACQLIGRPYAPALDILGAAYASAGRFDEAIIAAQRARDLAQDMGDFGLARQIDRRLQLYRDRKPYREPLPVR